VRREWMRRGMSSLADVADGELRLKACSRTRSSQPIGQTNLPFPGRSAARSTSRSGALQNRGPGCLRLRETGVPVLRSSASRSATRCIAPGTRTPYRAFERSASVARMSHRVALVRARWRYAGRSRMSLSLMRATPLTNRPTNGRHRSPGAAQRVALRGAVRCRTGVPVACASEKPGSRFCEAALREELRAASRTGHEPPIAPSSERSPHEPPGRAYARPMAICGAVPHVAFAHAGYAAKTVIPGRSLTERANPESRASYLWIPGLRPTGRIPE
jgi:hypothetical protein